MAEPQTTTETYVPPCEWCKQWPETSQRLNQPVASVRCTNRACPVSRAEWMAIGVWNGSRVSVPSIAPVVDEDLLTPLDEIESALISIAEGTSPEDAVRQAFDVINRERLKLNAAPASVAPQEQSETDTCLCGHSRWDHWGWGNFACSHGDCAKFVSAASPAALRDEADQLVDEVQHRMDQVVEAAVEWHQAGREGGEWFEASEKLGAAINSLLELRGDPNSMPRRWCSVHNCEEFSFINRHVYELTNFDCFSDHDCSPI